jgi:preprotein translocase subunit SecE
MANQEVAESKPSQIAVFFAPVRELIRETVGELRKVHWPSREDVRGLTIIILGVTLTMALLLGAADFLFSQLFAGILQAQPSIVSIAILVAIVVAVVVLVLFASRDRRSSY